jgi:APA family basic amino acid/polyamine antiporter
VASQYIFLRCRDVNHCSDDYDFDFTCNNGLLAGARVLLYMAQDGLFFKKAAQLNKASVPAWSIWARFLGFGFVLTGKVW